MSAACSRLRLLACGFVLLASGATAQEAKTQPGMAVSVVTTARRCFKDVVAVSGFLEPRNEMQVRPEREGLVISEVSVQPGDTVTSGQVLARLADPQTMQDDVTVTAPAAGLILESAAVAGSYASPGAPDPLFRLAVNGELEMKAEVLPADMTKLKAGQPVTLQSLEGRTLPGRLRVIDAGLDGMSQLGVARIGVPTGGRLRAGMFLRAEIDAGESCGIVVPLSAVLYGRDGPVVETVRNGRVEVRSIAVGVIASGEVAVLRGLDVNETVIARAGGFLREGDPVRVVGATKP